MFKNKRFLYGLGLGLILGAALLQLMNAVPKASDLPDSTAASNPDTIEVTLDDLKEKLEDSGYQVFEKNEKIYTQADVDSAAAKETSAAKETTAAKVKTEWAFFIPQGIGTSEVADMLLELKLIDNKDALIKALNDKHLNTKIQVKAYHLTEKPKLDDLILVLTTP